MGSREMNYEQKYNEALERAKQVYTTPYTAGWDRMKELIEYIFPELAESEDERIRKAIRLILIATEDEQKDFYSTHGLTRKDCTDWLEKLREQKESLHIPKTCKENADSFTDEDERIRKAIESIIRVYGKTQGEWIAGYDMDTLVVRLRDAFAFLEKKKEQRPNYCHHKVDLSDCSEEYRKAYYDGWNNCNQQHSQLQAEQKPAEWSEDIIRKAVKEVGLTQHQIDWFKTNVFPPKQEWSEEDEKMLNNTLDSLKRYQLSMPNFQVELQMRWLKSLRPSWKPSDEQIEYLAKAIDTLDEEGDCKTAAVLNELRCDLKKLLK